MILLSTVLPLDILADEILIVGMMDQHDVLSRHATCAICNSSAAERATASGQAAVTPSGHCCLVRAKTYQVALAKPLGVDLVVS